MVTDTFGIGRGKGDGGETLLDRVYDGAGRVAEIACTADIFQVEQDTQRLGSLEVEAFLIQRSNDVQRAAFALIKEKCVCVVLDHCTIL